MAPWNEALAEFELDPRGKPEFTPVFIQQEHLAATVGITVWFHTIYLLYILSSVNHIYGKSRAYIYEINNFFSPPNTHPYGQVKNGRTAIHCCYSYSIFLGHLWYNRFWLSKVRIVNGTEWIR